MRTAWICAWLVALAASQVQAQMVLQVPITAAEKEKLDRFVQGRNILQIDDYASPELDSLGPVEQLIFRKAVLAGGLDARFEDRVVPNSARVRLAIRNGEVAGGGQAQWHHYYQEAEQDYLESAPILLPGQYEKGLYTTQARAASLQIHALADLAPLSAVTGETWEIDLLTLKALPLKAVYTAATRPAQFRVVQSGRADFTLQDFAATPDMSIEELGVRLYPVQGVKIALTGSRHFLVSRKHADGQKVFAALQKGLAILQRKGDIARMLTQSGVLHPAVRNWRTLRAQE